MGKAAARKKTTTSADDPALDYLPVFDARQMLLGNLISMGWRLLLTVLIPIFIGVQLDRKFDTSPSLTLAAFFIAIFASGTLIYKTYNELNLQAAKEEADKARKTNKKVKRSKNA
ncbi:MAG: AtpZ/AtpI family protein [Candidatus Saccharimonadales bacterium]